jgi:glycosyltransferase involved in cell wall biosynthesis
MISVVIRNKNQENALEFLLRNLKERYDEDIAEIIVFDNHSTDNSEIISKKYNARFETIKKFSIGGSANFAAQKANFPIVFIFSAHSFPVSHGFLPAIFHYEIKRTKKKLFYRFKNDVVGNFQLWQRDVTWGYILNAYITGLGYVFKTFSMNLDIY